MRILFAAFLIVAPAWSATCTLQGSAALSGASWSCGQRPTTADSADLGGYTLTADQSWTFGIGSGTALIIGTGKLVINGGVTVQVNGNVTHAVVSKANYWIDQLAGSILSVSGTLGAASVSKAGTWRCRNATITSPTTFSVPAVSGSNSIDWDYCAISNAGSAGAYAVTTGYGCDFRLTHSTITNSSTIYTNGSGLANQGHVTLVKWNTFSNPVVSAACSTGMSNIAFNAAFAGNPTEIAYNTFTRLGWNANCGGSASADSTYADIHDNYVGGPGSSVSIAGGPNSSNNFLRQTVTTSIGLLGNPGTTIAFTDHSAGNPEGSAYNRPNKTGAVNGYICSYSGFYYADTGTCLFNLGGTLNATKVLSLPGIDGRGAFVPFQPNGTDGTILTNASHSTGHVGDGFKMAWGIGHSIAGGGMSISPMGAFRDNVFWTSGGTDWWMVYDSDQQNLSTGCAAYARTDTDLSLVGNNFGWPPPTTTSESGSCSVNSAHSYGGKWSAPPPGLPDTYANPNFVDVARSPITFPTKYLGRQASAGVWDASTDYAQGDTVTVTDPSVYGGAVPVLMRCWAAGCPSNGPKPGVGPNWRNTWEWEVLYELRTQVPAGTTYQDGALALQADAACVTSPCSVIRAMYNWIMRGFMPQNPRYRGKATDGTTPGAVQMGPVIILPLVQ